MSDRAVVAESVTKRFEPEGDPAVRSVSFEVRRGEMVVLLGPSGCGKTTLLKMVNRLYEPTSGRVLVDGRDVADVPVTDLRRRIGYVIQDTGLFPHMTIEDNVSVVPDLLGWAADRTRERVAELMELVGLPDAYRSRRPRQLSGGERQRVGIARALAADPDIMLMDEPFGSVDAITRVRLQEEFRAIQRQLHKTVLFVTHDVDEAIRMADRILVLRAGEVVQYDTPQSIVLAPADGFVERLLGADDALRRLSLLSVGDLLAIDEGAAEASVHGSEPAVTASLDDDLRSVLVRLLCAETDAVRVVDDGGDTVGHVGFGELRTAAAAARDGVA